MTRISDIYRYPCKGFGAQRLRSVSLVSGAGIPFDWFLGVAHCGLPIAEEGWATYIAFEDDSTRITLSDRSGATASARLDHPAELELLNRQLARWFPDAPADRSMEMRTVSNGGHSG